MNTLRVLFYLISIICVRADDGILAQNKVNLSYFLGHPAVEKFRDYLRIDTSKAENLKYAVEFWRGEAKEAGLEFAVYELCHKPICVLTRPGSDPSLPSIMLNSHMDVVTVQPEDWTYAPFEAHMDKYGNIYARGAQDTKDIGIQQIEAIKLLNSDNVTLQRTIHMTLIPDEETGSYDGMIPFLKSTEFKNLNVAFVLDEGLGSPNDTLFATYIDKRPWQMKFTVYGTATHGSSMPPDSAMDKFERLIEAITEYREEQKRLENSSQPYNNLNINIVKGGLAPNIVPSRMSLIVDMRLAVEANKTEVNEVIESWVKKAGKGTKLSYIRRIEESYPTSLENNPYWEAMQEATAQLGLEIKPIVLPATSDLIYMRRLGIPGLGFAPKLNTTNRMHGADEYLNAVTFVKGINIYYHIIKKLANTVDPKEYEQFETTLEEEGSEMVVASMLSYTENLPKQKFPRSTTNFAPQVNALNLLILLPMYVPILFWL